uniref:Acyl_transf_3 domain-containing protein n=1 Tax=Caenorhabditis tropicalis TaxID=1561998 RepID=A0A1I7UKA4_9PELO
MRKDIQCLRGVAIVSVFLYHLFPTLFVNGFLGVDIFKRILPLYFLVILLTVILVHCYLEDFLWENNDRYALASLFLVTNQLVIDDQADYFREFQAERTSLNVFVHLWSLSLEMQFYIFVPFIFIGLQILRKDVLKLIAVILITVIGFYFFALINPQFSFNFMFLRLWQFSSGFIALFCDRLKLFKKSEKSKKNEESKRFPIDKEDVFLESKTLCYIGDISYVMYLVHWPILSIFIAASVKSHLFCIMLTLISSIVLHHIFEKQYLKLNWKGIVLLVLILILGNGYSQYSIRNDTFWKTTIPKEIESIVNSNKKFFDYFWKTESLRDKCIENEIQPPHDKMYGYCKFPKGKGNFSIMMLGNSYVMNLGEHIRAHFNYNYSDYRYVSINEGYGIYADSPISFAGLEVGKKQVEIHKPDLLIIVARYTRAMKTEVEQNDKYVIQMNDVIEFYEKYGSVH